MRVPLEWLSDYVAIKLKPAELAHRLTLAGLEVTGIASVDGAPVLELEITPNRADCLSIIGVAREVAAITRQPLQQFGIRNSEFGATKRRPKSRIPHAAFRIHIEDRQGCTRYLGRLIDGVSVKPSPDWMRRRLSACGIRAINNIVDITNYVLLEFGQPLHAFDFERLSGGAIIVRRARSKEPITTLDGVARLLSPEALVIADADTAVAVAGIMGGAGSEVTPATTRVVLESAQFDPILIRRTGRSLGLASESSYRFERGVDPAGVETASARAATLLVELAGGRELAVYDAGAVTAKRTVISVDTARVSRWLGMPVSAATVRSTLAGLSCRVASSGDSRVLQVQVPSFRKDLVQDVDVIEELARGIGYDQIPSDNNPAYISGEHDAIYARTEALRAACAALGLWEIMTWALISEADLSGVALPSAAPGVLRVSNPLSQDHALLRPSLVPGLLQAAARNMASGASGVRLFELGHVFSGAPAASQTLRLGLAMCGTWEQTWHGAIASDLFRLKGIIERLVQRARQGELACAPARLPWAEPGQSMKVAIAGRPVGVLGQVARRIGEAAHVEQPIWIAELDAGLLMAPDTETQVISPSTLPPVKRDISFIVDRAVAYATVLGIIRRLTAPLASRIELRDRYTGSQIPPEKHSLTFSIEYRDPKRTLTADEVDQVHGRLREALVRDVGAQLR